MFFQSLIEGDKTHYPDEKLRTGPVVEIIKKESFAAVFEKIIRS